MSRNGIRYGFPNKERIMNIGSKKNNRTSHLVDESVPIRKQD
jgi:hypothetical protein